MQRNNEHFVWIERFYERNWLQKLIVHYFPMLAESLEFNEPINHFQFLFLYSNVSRLIFFDYRLLRFRPHKISRAIYKEHVAAALIRIKMGEERERKKI